MLEAYLPGGKLAGLVSQRGGKRILWPSQMALWESSCSKSSEEGTEPSGRRWMGMPLRITWRKLATGMEWAPGPNGKQRMLLKTEISSGEGEPSKVYIKIFWKELGEDQHPERSLRGQ